MSIYQHGSLKKTDLCECENLFQLLYNCKAGECIKNYGIQNENCLLVHWYKSQK